MPLNRQRGNMYDFVTHTLTCLAGACPHQCSYCYVNDLRRFPALAEKYSGEPRLVESDLRLNLGAGKVIFVADTGDLFANAIPSPLIWEVRELLMRYPGNCYLLQTKNPARFSEFDFDGLDVIFGTTLETNRHYCLATDGFDVSYAPPPAMRGRALSCLLERRKMVSIEPILDFDLNMFIPCIRGIAPEFVSIGADSKGHNLPEPDSGKVIALVNVLKEFTEVKVKSNLSRLINGAKRA